MIENYSKSHTLLYNIIYPIVAFPLSVTWKCVLYYWNSYKVIHIKYKVMMWTELIWTSVIHIKYKVIVLFAIYSSVYYTAVSYVGWAPSLITSAVIDWESTLGLSCRSWLWECIWVISGCLFGIRAVCQAPRSASATELRRQLHWLPVRQWITYKLVVITYKTRSTGNPAYLSHLIHDYQPARTLRSSDKLLLSVPQTTLTLSAKAFSVSAPSIWNSLSYNCRSADVLSTFKRILKTELFNIAYSDSKQSA